MYKKNMDRNLKYKRSDAYEDPQSLLLKKNQEEGLHNNRNEKRTNDTYSEKNKEDTTKYGEFIPSFHEWIPIEKQKSKAEYLENITK